MIEFRCRACRNLFFKGDFEGEIEVKCYRCNAMNRWDRRAEFTGSEAVLLDTRFTVGVSSK